MAVKTIKNLKPKTKRVVKKVEPVVEILETPNVMRSHAVGIRWALIVILCLLGVVGFWYKTNTWPIVAVVNYQPISRFEVDQQLFNQSGKEVVDGLITKKLIEQELKNKKITVTNAEVDTKMAEIKKQFGTEENFKQILTMQGMTEAQVVEQITLRIGLEKLVEPSTDSAKLQSDIAKLIDDLKLKAKIWTVK